MDSSDIPDTGVDLPHRNRDVLASTRLPAPPAVYHLYAEVLPNISAASVVAVPEERIVINNAVVATEGSSVKLTLNGATRSVTLPAPMKTIPRAVAPNHRPITELVFRYSLEAENLTGPLPSTRSLTPWDRAPVDDNAVPWGAEYMSRTLIEGEGVCRECRTPFLQMETIRAWKDLPREGWEEAVDMWHCHRPHEKPGDKKGDDAVDIDSNGNVAAGPSGDHPVNTRIQVAPCRGFVGLLYWLLAKAVCHNIEVCSSSLCPSPPRVVKKKAFAGAWLQTPWQ